MSLLLSENYKKGVILLLFLCFFQVEFKAQDLRSTYPVQVTAFINPPYSLRLEDYCNTATPKLSVSLLNRDLQKTTIDAKLHFSIKASNGIQLETKDYNYYPTLRLQAGTPYLLSQNDLHPYLQLENLETQGIISNGQFPEGMIEICIHVIEIQTGKIVSQTSCARAWINLNRPPLLNLPANNTRFPFREPQNILFQWTPRHQGLNNVEYEFILKEIRDENIAPEEAFGYSQGIYSATVRNTGLAYTAMMPPLMENQRYAWQVRAVAREGMEELSIFENNGYSEIHSFEIIRECRAPGNVRHRQEPATLIIEWTPEPEATTVLSYRAKDQGEWKTIRGEQDYTALFDLAPGIEYEYKAGTVCSDGTIAYSETQTVILEDWKKKFEIACGKVPVFDKSNFQPLETLRPGETFTAGDFPVTVTNVSGSNGVFSGKGYTALPLFGFVKIALQFNNVKINKDKQLADGVIETSYDNDEKLIGDLDRIWHGGDETGYTKTGAVVNNIKTNFDITNDADVEYDDGKLIFKDKNGKELGTINIPEKDRIIFDSGEPYTYTVEDKDGDIYTVTGGGADGKTTVENTGKKTEPLPEGSFSETQIASQKAVVEFIQGEDAVYAFDTWKDYYKTVSLIVNKNKYEFIGEYPVPCKLIPVGKSDYVGFKVQKTDSKLKEDSIIFKTKTGYTVIPKNGQLHISGGNDNDAQDLFALYPDGKGSYLTLGKLKILSYKEKTFNVVLVPVNSNTVDAHGIESYLNDVYNKVGIKITVTTDKSFSYPASDMQSSGSGLFSAYTDEMKSLNSAYRSQRGTDKTSVYLFILNKGQIEDSNPSGDMPRGKQFGYLFTANGGDIAWTTAHELGHGLFRLQHTFDGEYGGTAKSLKNQTDNLMDYGSGTHLAKWQWDEIHDPALLVNPFEGDEDAMAISFGKFTDSGFKLNKAGQALTPDGNLVNLPSGAEILFLCDDGNLLENGYLYKFSIENDTWVADITPQSWNILFRGYLKNGKKDESIVSLSKPKPGDQIIRISQHTYVSNERKLSVSLVKIKDSNNQDSYEVIEKGESQNVNVSCGDNEFWSSLKPGLENLNKQLNSTWSVNIIDKDGKNTNLVTGSKGTVTYKYNKNSNTWKVEISGISNNEVKQIITEAITQKLSTFSIDENGKSKIVTTTTNPFSTEDGGEFSFGVGLHWYEWGPTLCDVGASIYESSKLPETFWNKSNPKYQDYPLHTSPTFSGLIDGAIEEITEVAQLVKLGVEVVTDKKKATDLWKSVKNINWNSIKEVAIGAIKEKWDKYANSPDYITYHELGKDGAQIASMLYGGFAVKGKKLTETVEESGEIIKKKADDIVNGKAKFLNLPNKGFINPKEVRFSQSDISKTFRDGSSVEDLIKGLKNGSIDPNSVTPIRIVEKDGLIYTLDNRRLKAFQEADMDIPYEKLDKIPENELFKFTTTNDGTSIIFKGEK
ncbi:hypothetical protein FACS1894155_07630 [Bacteroidia bacterium]|nr:hypothetical protein FACS1894155_07630 [Bacteroidia bacterium]